MAPLNCLLLALLLTVSWPLDAFAQARNELPIKVKLTLALSRYAQWPAPAVADEPLRLCVAHNRGAVANAFAEVDGQAIGRRKLQVLAAAAPPVAICEVLFVDASAERQAELLVQAGRSPVLTIGDAEGFVAKGGMVELVSSNDSIRFDVNVGALRAAKLGLSSQALRLARHVVE